MKKRQYTALAASTFLNGVGSNVQLSVWPFFLQLNGVGDELYGAFTAASNIFAILVRAASGKLGNASESLPFILAVLASTGMMFVFALLPNQLGIVIGMILAASWMPLFLVGRTILVGGGGRSSSLATGNAMLITLSNVGLIVGVALGTAAFSGSGYFMMFLLGGTICLSSVVLTIWLPRKSTASNSRFGFESIKRASPMLRRFYIATCLDTFAWNLALPFFAITPARIFQVTETDIALIQGLMFAATTAPTIIFAILSDRLWGRKSLLAGSEALGVVTLVVYLAAPNVQPIFVSAVLMGLVNSSWGPVTSAYVSEASESGKLNENVGTWQTLTALVRVPAPMIGGFLAEHWFARAPYLVALVFVVFTAAYIQTYLHDPLAKASKSRGASLLRIRPR